MKLNNRLNKISVKWKIFIFMTAFVAFVIVLLWIMQVVFLDSFYKRSKTNEIKSTASTIKNNIDNEDLGNIIQRLTSTADTTILLMEPDGNILYNSENRMMGPIYTNIYRQIDNLIIKIKENNGEYIEYDYLNSVLFNSQDGGNKQGRPSEPQGQARNAFKSILYSSMTSMSDGTEVVIVLNTNITPVDSTIQTIRSQLIIITVILLSAALLLALIISVTISRPIMNINRTSRELAKGNYNIFFKGDGYREIAELSETLNYAASELSKVDDYRKELLANVSHDLRTPLTLITGYSEAVRDLPGEDTPENIQIIIDEAKRLTTLVNDVLDISKYESNVQTLNLSEYNLTESIGELVNRVAKMTEPEGYDIKFIYDREVFVQADEFKISRALYNLLGNAITYTGGNKKVLIKQEISGGSGGETVRISVIDTGDGIPGDKLKNIWDRYYKVNKEHRRAQVGTGLGLSIVKAVFDLHKIHYGVTSEIGKGSIFWFELPVL